MAQTCRNEELMPNDLLPKIRSAGTVSPIKGPATYQGHGCLIISSIPIIVVLVVKSQYKISRHPEWLFNRDDGTFKTFNNLNSLHPIYYPITFTLTYEVSFGNFRFGDG